MTALRAVCLALALVPWPAGGAGDAPRIATPYPLARDHVPGETYMGVRLLGALKLATVEVDGRALSGLSGLAWDQDEGVLYALSDRGSLFHLLVSFGADGLLADVRAARAFALLDSHGRALAWPNSDGEGLAARNTANGVRGDSELAVSFERHHRVVRYSTSGVPLGRVALPRALLDARRYRSANRGLEALAWHPREGYLAAPELPFRDVDDGHVELHALTRQRMWRYPLAVEPNAGLTDMTVLPDGSLLTLERGHGVFLVPFIISLRRVRALPGDDGALLHVETLARFSTGQGWALDNFEGLAVQDGRRILMVSDDNARSFQSTLLAAFELLDTDRSPAPATDLEAIQGSAPR